MDWNDPTPTYSLVPIEMEQPQREPHAEAAGQLLGELVYLGGEILSESLVGFLCFIFIMAIFAGIKLLLRD
jgi:hypothetical protein